MLYRFESPCISSLPVFLWPAHRPILELQPQPQHTGATVLVLIQSAPPLPHPAFTSRLHRTARKNEVHANDSGENRKLTKSVGTGMEEAILNCLEIAGRTVVRRAARIGLGIWMYLREKGKRKGKKRGRKGWN